MFAEQRYEKPIGNELGNQCVLCVHKHCSHWLAPGGVGGVEVAMER